ncbi:MAG TPA: FecR domain-containing protein [Opitutaceae bacterium]|nr:FecR domain-containing protein [Opitutaceae bacterium]
MERNPEMRPSGPTPSADPVAQAAAEWVARRDRVLTPAEVAALAEWLEADPRHAAEYTRMSGGWEALDGIGEVPELAAMADAVSRRAAAGHPYRRLWWAAAGLAAAAALVVALKLWPVPRAGRAPGPVASSAEGYRVLPSTARRTVLPDGSVVELNGDSRIDTSFTPAERRIMLVKGEANFTVAKDPARPFIVSAGTITVRATGTAFNVRLAADFVEILVTEGKVRLGESAPPAEHPLQAEGSLAPAPSGPVLNAGQRAFVKTAVDAGIPITIDTPSRSQIDETLAWQGTQLVFDRTPLDQVIAAFNHRNARQLVLADPALRNRTLSGVFRADNVEGFIHLLPASVDLVAERQGDNRILLRAAP